MSARRSTPWSQTLRHRSNLLVVGLMVVYTAGIAAADEVSENGAGRRDVPPPSKPSPAEKIRVLFNETYVTHADESDEKAGRCDVYLPSRRELASVDGDVPAIAPPSGRRPAIIVVHGGGWTSGDKWTMAGYCRDLAKLGFVVINVNYRLAPRHRFPAQVDDIRAALLWTVDQADRFDIDTERIGLFGYSAGGHLAALIGVLGDESPSDVSPTSDWPPEDPRWERLPRVRAVCAGGPPCEFRDLPPHNTLLAYFLGGSRAELPDIYRAASPPSFASADDPPTLIIHGERDFIVPIASSQALFEALREQGADCRMECLPNQGHMGAFLDPRAKRAVTQFFSERLIGTDPSVQTARRTTEE